VVIEVVELELEVVELEVEVVEVEVEVCYRVSNLVKIWERNSSYCGCGCGCGR
jgi:hypothetical protein